MYNFLTGNKDSLSKKASYLRIASRSLAESLKTGSFSSLYKGQGIEFSGVREYLRGDDVRSIDWNVTARMSKPYVKMFDEEHELQVFLIVDRSASMFSGSRGRLKYSTAAEVSALITLACEYNASPVGAVFFDGGISLTLKPEAGKDRTMLLLSHLDKVENVKPGSVLGNAIQGAAKVLKKRTLVFIISDFRTQHWQDSFKLLAQKNDVVAVRVTDNSDWLLENMGSIPFTDRETGVRMVLPTSSASFKTAWREDFRQRTEKWSDFCLRHGVSPVSISTSDDTLRVLSSFFKEQRK